MVGRPPDEEAVFDRDIATKSTGGTKDPAPIDGLVPTGIKVYGLKVMTQPAPAKKQ